MESHDFPATSRTGRLLAFAIAALLIGLLWPEPETAVPARTGGTNVASGTGNTAPR